MLRTVLDTDCLVLPDRLLTPGRITIDEEGRIAEIQSRHDEEAGASELRRFLAPGLVDLQVNGFSGIDLLTADSEDFQKLGQALLHSGVTGYLPTLISAPVPKLLERLEALATWCEPSSEAATPLGMHLEGPFLSPKARGTHRRSDLLAPDATLMEEFLSAAAGRIRLVTIAPELPGALDLIELLHDKGILVSLGHSQASYECTLEAAERGASLVTHFGNAMGPIHQRAPGLPGAGLVDARLSLGLIPDLLHLHPGILRLAWQAKGRDGIVLVSDAIAAAGLADGEYSFGERRIQVENGVCRDEEGHMAGASLGLFDGMRRFLHTTGISPCAGFQLAASNPARQLGLIGERGSLHLGSRADLLGLVRTKEGQLELDSVYLAGRSIELNASRAKG
jgi:N-acetylglucosamine-6-phosphate deacetylase